MDIHDIGNEISSQEICRVNIMSVDLLDGTPAISTPTNRCVRDLVIIFGGFAMSEDGANSEATPLPPTPAYSASGDLLKRIQNGELTPAPGHMVIPVGFKGRATDVDVRAGYNFICNNFDPLGKLIITGHSMGGAASQRLSRMVQATPFYDIKKQTLAGYELGTPEYNLSPLPKQGGPMIKIPTPAYPTQMKRFPNPLARVDLLVTVDAAVGNFSENLDRSIPACVRTNLNYYQTTRIKVEKSCGGPNAAVDKNRTIVWNHDLTDRLLPDPDSSKPATKPNHYSIQAQLNNMLMKIFQRALKVDQITDFCDA